MKIILIYHVSSMEKFWRESAARLNEKNYELLKILIQLLESSKDPLILSVACFDLGAEQGGNLLHCRWLSTAVVFALASFDLGAKQGANLRS